MLKPYQIKSLTKTPIPIWLAYIMLFSCVQVIFIGHKNKPIIRDWADFTIPTPFGTRVRNALKAEPRSVKLSNLVGAGGLWYGFGKMIMDM
jgi:GINS complex subunit 3